MADISNNTVKLSISQPDKDSVVTDEQVSVRMCSSTSNNLAVMNKRIDTGIYFIAIYAVIECSFSPWPNQFYWWDDLTLTLKFVDVYVHLFTHVHLDYNNFYFSLMIPLIITVTTTIVIDWLSAALILALVGLHHT